MLPVPEAQMSLPAPSIVWRLGEHWAKMFSWCHRAGVWPRALHGLINQGLLGKEVTRAMVVCGVILTRSQLALLLRIADGRFEYVELRPRYHFLFFHLFTPCGIIRA